MNQKEIMKKHRELVDKSTRLVTKAYTAYFNSVEKFLMNAMVQNGELSPKYSEQYVYSSLEVRREQLQKKLKEIADKQMEEAFLLGFLLFEQETNESTGKSYNTAVIKSEVVAALEQVTMNTENRIRQVVRTVYQDKLFNDISKRRAVQELEVILKEKQAVEVFIEELKKNGFVGIVDSANRRWNPEVYAKMLFRTKMSEANIAVQKEQGKLYGIDLAYISGVPVDNPCNNWIGVIVSLNGINPNFPTYEQVKATKEIFHPNCQHYLIPVRNLANVPEYVLKATSAKYNIPISQLKEI